MSRYLKDFQEAILSGTNDTIPFDSIHKCQPFVFHGDVWDNKLLAKLDASMDGLKELKSLDYEFEYDSPFSLFSVERADGKSIFDGNKEIGIYMQVLRDNMDELTPYTSKEQAQLLLEFSEHTLRNTFCIMVYESSPRVYVGLAFVKSMSGGMVVTRIDTFSFHSLMSNLIDVINKNVDDYASERNRHTLRYREGREHKKVRVDANIIHMYPKGNIKSIQSRTGNGISFDIRFMVRGHWRKLEEGKVGKNRAGEYNVDGMTWVTEHERGDKDAPLIKQVRVVDAVALLRLPKS